MESMEDGSVALLPSARVQFRNRDAEYPFRQDSDFYYLTGFEEPDCVLALAPGREQGQTILFCRDRDAPAERYAGTRLGPERAAPALGLDDAFPSADLDDILPGIVEGRGRVYLTLGRTSGFRPPADRLGDGYTRPGGRRSAATRGVRVSQDTPARTASVQVRVRTAAAGARGGDHRSGARARHATVRTRRH